MTGEPVMYGLAHCDTVKRARAWLQARGVAYHFHDFKKSGVPPQRLDAWMAAVGWDTLLNRRGTTWRRLDETARTAAVDADSARTLMLAAPSLIKRPVVQWPHGAISVGFDATDFAARLAAAGA